VSRPARLRPRPPVQGLVVRHRAQLLPRPAAATACPPADRAGGAGAPGGGPNRRSGGTVARGARPTDAAPAGDSAAAAFRRLLLRRACGGPRYAGGDRDVALACRPAGPGRRLPKGLTMLPIAPAELSAFLDGELPAARADEVRAALAQDPVLRQS